MKKTIPAVALALVLAACGAGGDVVVATVGDAEITVAEVEELYSVNGQEGSGSTPEALFRENLRNAIVEEIVIAVASTDYGITFSADDIEARRASLEDQVVAQSGGTYEDFLELQGFTDQRIRRIAHQQLVAEAIENELVTAEGAIPDEDLQDAYDQRLFELTEACVSHLLVPTEEEAEAAYDRIDAGETFEEVAMDVGTDGTAPNGGDLGCTTLNSYVVEFSTAALEQPIDVVSTPVQSEFGYHLLLVRERTTTPFEDVVDQIRASIEALRGQSLVQDWLLEVVTSAAVSIDQAYGSWVTDPAPNVVPPQ